MRPITKRLALLGISTALAMLLSYVEAILPPIATFAPGIKIGLANVVILFLLYQLSFGEAFLVSLVRVTLVSLLFGNITVFLYSMAGAVLSILAMYLLKKTNLFSTVGVSIAGGVFHNLGQILTAMWLLSTKEIGYYMIVLTVTGVVAGVLVGLLGGLVMRYVKKIPNFHERNDS